MGTAFFYTFRIPEPRKYDVPPWDLLTLRLTEFAVECKADIFTGGTAQTFIPRKDANGAPSTWLEFSLCGLGSERDAADFCNRIEVAQWPEFLSRDHVGKSFGMTPEQVRILSLIT